MKLMAKNRALAIVLAMMMVLMLALPLTAYATPESTGTQVHVKKTEFEISSI